MKNKKMLMFLLAFFMGISGIVYSYRSDMDDEGVKVASNNTYNYDNNLDNQDKDESQSNESSDMPDGEETTQQNEIFVYVCGFVNSPGMYSLDSGSRVADAIKLAGGMTKEADIDYINQAMPLSDGVKIYVPSKEETANLSAQNTNDGLSDVFPGSANLPVQEADDKININTATKEQLMSLNGIGESRAQDIIDYREQNGGFSSIEDIKNVTGIKDAIFQKICDDIKVQ